MNGLIEGEEVKKPEDGVTSSENIESSTEGIAAFLDSIEELRSELEKGGNTYRHNSILIFHGSEPGEGFNYIRASEVIRGIKNKIIEYYSRDIDIGSYIYEIIFDYTANFNVANTVEKKLFINGNTSNLDIDVFFKQLIDEKIETETQEELSSELQPIESEETREENPEEKQEQTKEATKEETEPESAPAAVVNEVEKVVPESAPPPQPEPAPYPIAAPVRLEVTNQTDPEDEEDDDEDEDMEEQENLGTPLEIARTKYMRFTEKVRQDKTGYIDLNIKLQDAEAEYYNELNIAKEELKKNVQTSLNISDLNALSVEDRNTYNAEVKRRVFDELVAGEHDRRMDAINEYRKSAEGGEKWKTYMQNSLRWYTRQSKFRRFAMTTALGAAIGYFAGTIAAGSVISYGVQRGARFAATSISSGYVAKKAQNSKRLSIEEINEKEKAEKEALKTSFDEDDLKGNIEKYGKIEKENLAEKKKRLLKKSALVAATGAGAGMLTGLAEHMLASETVVHAFNAPEAKPKVIPMHENLPKKVSVDHAPGKQINVPENNSPKVASKIAESEKTTPLQKEEVKINKMDQFEHKKIKLREGDSVWKVTKRELENNPKFHALDNAQKKSVVSSIVNRVMNNPEDYEVDANGSLKVGTEIDVGKIIHGDDLNKLIEKASKLSEAQKQAIEENSQRIATWLKHNPGKKLDESVVQEILSTKPEAHADEILGDEEMDTAAHVGGNDSLLAGDEEMKVEGKIPEEVINQNIASRNALSRQLQDQIDEARSRPAPSVGGEAENVAGATDKQNALKAISAEKLPTTRSMNNDFIAQQRLNEIFREELDRIYAENRMWGIFNTRGWESSNWKSVRAMPVTKFMQFFSKDSAQSPLDPAIKSILTSVPEHQKMFNHVQELIKVSKGAITPIDQKETLEAYVKRLGGYIMKMHENVGEAETMKA